MNRFLAVFLPVAALWLLFPPTAGAQTLLEVQAQLATGTVTLSENGTLTVASPGIDTAASAGVRVANRGTAPLQLPTIALTGSSEFTLTSAPPFPLSLAPGQAITLQLRFRPGTSARVSARLAITYQQDQRSGVFAINLAGITPEVILSYVQQPSGNTERLGVTPLEFPATNVGASAVTAIIATNRGSAPTTFEAAAATGDAFQIAALPLLPVTLESGRDSRFNLVFSPRRIGASTGTIAVTVGGVRHEFSVQGTGRGSDLRYEIVREASPEPVVPGGTISFPSTVVNETSRLLLRLHNTGNLEARVTTIATSGAGFQATDLPLLPVTIAPDSELRFTITFQPTAPGDLRGQLRVGEDLFALSGQGSGSTLRFTYRSNLTNATLNNNGTIVFPTAAIGASAQVVLRIANEGTAAGTLSSAGIAGSNTPFSFGQTPPLPLSLEPGDAVEWTLRFRPSALGNASTILRVDGYAFTLSGVGEAPPALPAFDFTGFGNDATAPMEQLSFSLHLTEPYPLPLRGTLTIEHRTDAFASDPAVQFASGGRTAPFTIPAGATEAIFANQASSVRFQTGSVAGTIQIRPSFLTESGFDLTPEGVPTAAVRIAEATPVVLTSSIASRTATSFSLQLTAFATNRSITRLDIQFRPVAGVTLTTPSTSLDVASTFRTWYQSQQSQQYGSLFTLTIPFNLQGSLSNGMSMIDALESVSVTMANSIGTSPQTTVNLK